MEFLYAFGGDLCGVIGIMLICLIGGGALFVWLLSAVAQAAADAASGVTKTTRARGFEVQQLSEQCKAGRQPSADPPDSENSI